MVSAAAGFAGSAAFNYQAARAVRWHRTECFESEEYASILKFVGYRRVGARVKSFRESTFTNVFLDDSYWRTLELWYWQHVFGQSFDFTYCRRFTFTQQCSFATVD